MQEACNGFAVLTETDPDCAMAYGGVTMSLVVNPLQLPLKPDTLQQGWAAVVQAKHMRDPTPRDQTYIDGVDVFFMEPDRLEPPGRELAFEPAIARLSRH